MPIQIIRSLTVLLFALAFNSMAATWYVRPLVRSSWSGAGIPVPTAGVYGSQDGTSYANAWNGLQAIVFGSGGVDEGDTLYICGSHIAAYDAGNSPDTTSFKVWITQSGITIRGDYPDDPALVFGGAIDGFTTYNWSADGNGVYSAAAGGGSKWSWAVMYEIIGGIPYRLLESTNTTWEGLLGYAHFASAVNYLKTTSGVAPGSATLAIAGLGWMLSLTNGLNNVTFSDIQWFGGGLGISEPVSYVGCTNITFANCVLTHGYSNLGNSYIHVEAGHDYWNIINCEIGYTGEGIQSDLHIGRNDRGSVGWVVSGNYFHDISTTAEYPNTGDPHAIGLQGCSSWLISSNRIERSGAAIEFWTDFQGQSNNIVSYNFIKDVYTYTLSGSGIVFTPPDPGLGLGDGNKVFGNIILNTGLDPIAFTPGYTGAGIDLPPTYFVEIYNNTIINAIIGINLRTAGNPALGNIVNNLIYNARTNFLNFAVGNVDDFYCDYNLFYNDVSLAVPFNNAPAGHDVNAVLEDPLFFATSPSTWTDVKLQAASPAIGAGTNMNLAADYFGRPYANPPAIGAAEYDAVKPRKPRRNGPGRFRGM